jgi:hypothetical protein
MDLSWLIPLVFCGSSFGQNGALRITEPTPSKDRTFVTNEPAISLQGTLAWTGGDQRMLWESSRGFSDLAAVHLADDRKTILWNSTSPVPLRPGINHVRIKALGQPGAASFVNVFYTPRTPAATPVLGTTILHGKQITYEVRDGLAIYQSDMILGKAADVAAGGLTGRFAATSPKRLHPEASTIAPNILASTGLWPMVNGVVRIPYTNPSGVNATNVNAAIAEANAQLAGVLQWVPATASDVNLVEFDFDPNNSGGGCESAVGMQGNTQTIGGSYTCTTTTILHEMGHTMGLFHEQSRADRDTYVNYIEQNIDKPQHGNFDIAGSSSVDSGLYNYASIMEYGPFEFARDGVSVVLETIPAGMVLGTNMPQYTTGDLDGIMRLYAHAPSSITVDTNPTGLQVVVDNTPCTAPCVFTTWTIGSQHTLKVTLDTHNQTLQTLNQQNYVFGRWNAGTANVQTVTVTNSLGNGTLPSPSTTPAITNYLASFIPVHPYNPVVAPGGNGTITSSPPPSSLIINGRSTNYYQDRQLITMTVNPISGWTFYFWYNLPGFSLYANPYTFSVTTDLDYLNFDPSFPVTAGLYNDAVTTIKAASPDISAAGTFPGFAIGVVDGNGNTTTAYTPRNYDASGDGSGFASGANLTLCGSALDGSTCPGTAVAQSPVTTNISYLFNSWSGAKSASTDGLSVSVPVSAGQSIYAANYTPSFRTIVEPSWTCGGNEVTSSPAGTNSIGTNGNLDAFFNTGTVDFTATAGSGMAFVGWSQDLSGTTNPLPFSLSGQVIGTANFNTTGTTAPLTIASVSPAIPAVTSGPLSLTVNGTGFTTNSAVTFTYLLLPNNTFGFRSNTLVSPTQLMINLQAGDISTAGYYQITVLNVGGCNPQAYYNFPVANSAGPPVLGITKSHTGNFGQGQQNAQYTVLTSNTGTGSSVDPVTVTETVPSGETLVSMSGSGWTCTLSSSSCTRSDALAAAMSYGAITVTVNVATNASSPQVNTAIVSGGGASSATATDSTTIVSQVSVPNVVGDTQAAATAAITSAGLVVGTVTVAFSSTVPSGNVISESPAAGTLVVAGSVVNLVVSTGPGGTPAVVSVTPDPATGLSNTFVLTFSDTAGNASLNHVGAIFNPAASASSSCYLLYYPAVNLLYLLNNAGSASTKITPGSGTLSNSQCTINGSGTSVVKAGNNLTLNLAVTASSTYTGKQSIFMYADDNNSVNTGWVNKGTWTPATNQPPAAVSVTPNPASGLSNTFALTYSDPNGASDLNVVEGVFGPAASGSNSCFVLYYPATDFLYLLTNAGKATSKITPGSGTLSNSQCTISGSGISVVRSGDNLTLNLAVTASSTYTGKQSIFMYADDNSSANTGYVNKGTWAPAANQPPALVSVTPNPATGLSNTFALTYSDPNGASDLDVVKVVFNPAVSSSNSCFVMYYPATNLLYLLNNAGTGSTKITPASGTLSNSQCTISGSGTSVVRSGDNLTLNLAVTASSTYTGKQSILMFAEDNSAATTGWVNKGTWTP